jgi:hypothetical protein
MLKIETVESQARGRVGTQSERSEVSRSRPPSLKLRRDCGQGLWIFEQDDGQLYIGLKRSLFAPPPCSTWPSADERLPPLVDSDRPPWA